MTSWGIFENKNYTYYGQFKNNRFYGLGLVKFKNNISFADKWNSNR